MSLRPGCRRALPGSRAGGAGRTQAPCGLAPIPSSGDHTCSIGYPGQTGYMSCILRGGRISARGPGGTGPPPVIRKHELYAAACIQVDLGQGIGTLLRAEPNNRITSQHLEKMLRRSSWRGPLSPHFPPRGAPSGRPADASGPILFSSYFSFAKVVF
jgi:hypothetical protein